YCGVFKGSTIRYRCCGRSVPTISVLIVTSWSFWMCLSSNPMRFDLVPKWLSTPESQQILHYYCQFQLDPKLMGHARNIGSRLQQVKVENMHDVGLMFLPLQY
ncbi:hypothetical protein OSTOST_12861, partial [Ostertagia ostertagi]